MPRGDYGDGHLDGQVAKERGEPTIKGPAFGAGLGGPHRSPEGGGPSTSVGDFRGVSEKAMDETELRPRGELVCGVDDGHFQDCTKRESSKRRSTHRQGTVAAA